MEFCQAALRPRDAVLVFLLLHLQHLFVLLEWKFCLSGICVSANQTQTLQSYVPTACNIAFILPFFCIVGRNCQFQSVTFPLIIAATVHRLGNCDKQMW